MNQSKDRFSDQAREYATFRPRYPQALYDFIFSHVKKFDVAWDAGTGNGQVARDLSKLFSTVYATDISVKQLANAYRADTIMYSLAGEETEFPDGKFNLITVAQAIHWFDMPKFYEVNRVATKEALLAVWGYSLLSITAPIDKRLQLFYTKVVGPYWDAERKLIDEQYKTIPFPFVEIPTPEFNFSVEWTLAEFEGYLSTWSAVQKYIQANHKNPVEDFMKEIHPFWNGERQTVTFPLFLRFGRIE
ncbi:MAG: class I SAM-dependent methyltransferase [Bacteroidia bacterium]|nr:class I SAM-dependent methyltransferase [Bacteroidia bacterium]